MVKFQFSRNLRKLYFGSCRGPIVDLMAEINKNAICDLSKTDKSKIDKTLVVWTRTICISLK